MRIILITFFTLILNISALFPQSDNEILVKIGNKTITKKEFRNRFEFNPHINRISDSESFKKQFLYTLIAEKLFALEAVEQQADTTEIAEYWLNMLRKMLARDALYKKEIKENIQPVADSLTSVYIDEPSNIIVEYISMSSEDSAFIFYNELQKGKLIDPGFENYYLKNSDTLYLSRGDVEQDIEDILFKTSAGKYTEPVFGLDKYFIFKVIGKNFPVLTKSKNWEEEYKKLIKAADKRAEEILYRKFMNKIFRDKKINANGYLLQSLADEISILFKEKNRIHIDKFYLNLNDLVKLENQLKNVLGNPFIILEKDTVLFKNFIRYFMFEEFSSESSDRNEIISLLNHKTRKFIEQEILAAIAFEKGLENDPEVLDEFNTWKDYYLFTTIKQGFSDSVKVSDEELLEYYNKTRNAELPVQQVNIIEVLVDSLETAEIILNELLQGTDIKILAEKYSQRESAKNRNGESGYFPVTQNGDIGRIASEMEVGEVYGPLKVENGYSIFKVIGKKDSVYNFTSSFEEEKEFVKNEYIFNKYNERLEKLTADLAEKYNVQIYEDKLREVNVIPINMVAYKLLGFGGKITAVPIIPPFNNWIKQWLKASENVP